MATNIIDRLQNGAVFEVPLLGDNGYAYIKLQKIKGYESIEPVFRVINYHSANRISGDIAFLETLDYVYVPLILLGIPRVRGKLGWKYIGDLALKFGDSDVPHFSFTMKGSALRGYDGLSIEDVSWSIVTALSMWGLKKATLDDVKGLGIYTMCASFVHNSRLTFFWNRRLNLGLDVDALLKEEGLYDIIDVNLWKALIDIEDPLVEGLPTAKTRGS